MESRCEHSFEVLNWPFQCPPAYLEGRIETSKMRTSPKAWQLTVAQW